MLDSKQNIAKFDAAGNIVGQSTSSFFGIPDLSYNATLAYDSGPIGIWRNPEESLDLQLTWNVNDRIGITFDAVNLIKAKQQEYYKFEDVGGPDQFNLGTVLIARTCALGVRFNFD